MKNQSNEKKIVIGSPSPFPLAAAIKIFEEIPSYKIVAKTTDLQEIPRLVAKHRPDVVMLDAYNDVRTLEAIFPPGFRDAHKNSRLVILGATTTDKLFLDAYDYGADALISRTQDLKSIVSILNGLDGDHRFFSQADVANVRERFATSVEGRFERLEDCDREILRLLAVGKSDKEIAATVFLANQTVRNRISRLFKQFGSRNRVELAVLLQSAGVIPQQIAS